MRYLLDTNTYIYWATDQDLLDVDVYDLLNEPDAVLCISAESVRELIVAYNAKGWGRLACRSSPATLASTSTDDRALTSSSTRSSPPTHFPLTE